MVQDNFFLGSFLLLKKSSLNSFLEYVRKPSYGGGTSHVHAAGVHHYRWHDTRMSSLSQATRGTPVSQERRGLLDYDVLDKNQNLIFHSENIPPMLKGIAFNEESKSQPERDGL